MPEFLKTLLASGEFIPHGHCYLWKPELVLLHVVSDSLIALAYYSIPIMLVYFVRKRRDVPFDWIFLMFGIFIVACGTTHLLEIWTLWHPTYWLSGFIKAITALASLCTAALLLPLIPKVLALPSPAQLEATNQALRNEITQRKLVEEALRVSEGRLQAILDNAPAVIYLKDTEGRFILVNRQFESLLQMPKELICSKNDYDIFPSERAETFRANDQQVLEAGTPLKLEEVVPEDDGIHTYISIKFPLYNSHGVAYGICGISTDISERKEAEETLKRANEELEVGVRERTAKLALSNESLQAEIAERKQAEAALRASEQRFRAIFNQAAVGMAQVGVKGQWLLVNQKLCDIVGYTHQELLERTFQDITHPDDLDTDLEYVRQLLAGAIETYSMEKRYIHKDSSFVWINLTVSLVRHSSGEPKYFIAIVEDISDAKAAATLRKQAIEELQESYNLLQAVIEGTPDAIFAKDIQGYYVIVNSTTASIIGKPVEEILGRNDTELFPPFLVPSIMDIDRRIMTTGEAQIFEEDVPTGGNLRTYLTAKSVWRDIQGNIIGLIGVAKDISDRKRAEQEIRELNENLERRVVERTAELEAANKELEAFSYSVSHDLRAPLRAVDGFSKALLERYVDNLDDKGKHYLQRIRTGTQRMGELIDDLLALSRVTRTQMRRTAVDLSALAGEIAAELHSTQPERQVEFAIAPGLVADGDISLLRVVLENLLNNALKFTSAHTQTRIEFGAILQADAKLAYFVKDNGAGFDMAYVNKLFGAFQRLHTTSQFPGTGIGLATVQRIIHRHGGRVWAEGAVEQGATFYFTL